MTHAADSYLQTTPHTDNYRYYQTLGAIVIYKRYLRPITIGHIGHFQR